MATELSAEQVDALLDLLSSDDAYRELFMKDLGAALQRLPGKPGVPDGVRSGGCLMPAKLADKEKLRRSRDRIRNDLTSRNAHIPKVLEA